MEKEACILKKEIKICLPAYKMLYSAAFVVILSLIRGISRVSDIGLAMEPPIGLLAIVFCADTYWIEIQSKRAEVFKLYHLKKQTSVLLKRLAVQMVYLEIISIVGYGLFFWQKPRPEIEGTALLPDFVCFLPAAAVTIIFWGTLSMTFCNLFRNIWIGIGSSLFLWVTLNSQAGDRVLGKYNIFSYTFRNVDYPNDFSWMWGKIISILLALVLAALIPFVLKKRG